MSKIKILSIIGAVMLAVTGCLPSAESMTTTSTAIGVATGTVLNMTKFDDASKQTISDILIKVQKYVPGSDETFTIVWTKVAKEHLDEMVKNGKLNNEQATLISGGVAIICKGIDYIFTKRFPDAKGYADLVSAAINGFINGVTAVFTPSNPPRSVPEMDKDAYEYLLKK